MPQSDDMRPARLWRSMPTDQRVSAAAAFWRDEQAALEQAKAVALIARHIKFRPKSVLALPVEKKAKHLATMAQVSDLLAARLLVAYHLEHQRPMMGAFLNALGIAHEDGLIKDESPKAPDSETLEKGIAALISLASVRSTCWSRTTSTLGNSVFGTTRVASTTLGFSTSTRGVVATKSAGIATAIRAMIASSA